MSSQTLDLLLDLHADRFFKNSVAWQFYFWTWLTWWCVLPRVDHKIWRWILSFWFSKKGRNKVKNKKNAMSEELSWKPRVTSPGSPGDWRVLPAIYCSICWSELKPELLETLLKTHYISVSSHQRKISTLNKGIPAYNSELTNKTAMQGVMSHTEYCHTPGYSRIAEAEQCLKNGRTVQQVCREPISELQEYPKGKKDQDPAV